MEPNNKVTLTYRNQTLGLHSNDFKTTASETSMKIFASTGDSIGVSEIYQQNLP